MADLHELARAAEQPAQPQPIRSTRLQRQARSGRQAWIILLAGMAGLILLTLILALVFRGEVAHENTTPTNQNSTDGPTFFGLPTNK